jgi:2-aminoethylphosphonate transport system ATP-binding protein
MSSAGGATAGGNRITFDGVTVAYRGNVVLNRFSLDVGEGEIMALIGPSGSGKTTALRAVAGFVRPVAGRVRIGSTDVTDLPPYMRGIGMVVQNYALFPHMRVADNVAFGLKAQGASRSKVAERVDACLGLVDMSGFNDRFPSQLSGGQQQRVAIARALAIEPRVLLLDEPLSALDAQIRRAMVEEIAKLHRDLPALTVLYVTHDQSEALTLADRIAVMRDGNLSAAGPSQQLYRRPPNRFTAEFLGSANMFPIRVNGPAVDGVREVDFNGQRLRVSGEIDTGDGQALLCVRPHALKLSADGTPAPNTLSGRVQSVLWQGDHHMLRVDCADTPVRITTPPLSAPPEPGETIAFNFLPEDASLVPLGDA